MVTPLHLPDYPQDENTVLGDIHEQLLRRQPVPDQLWGTVELARIARNLGELCAEIAGLPKGRFYPEDPFKLMILEDMAEVDVQTYLRNQLKIKTPINALEGLSFGQVVSLIQRELKQCE